MRISSLIALASLSLVPPVANAYSDDWPSAALTAQDAVEMNTAQFLPVDQQRAWQVDLDQRGLRAAGSPAQDGYIDALRERLIKAGVPHVYEEPFTLTRWNIKSWSLDLVGKNGPERVPTASFVPFSGSTPAAGITAPLQVVEKFDDVKKGSLAGRIVLVQLHRPNTSLEVFAHSALREIGLDKPASEIPFNRLYFATKQLGGIFDGLQRSGASGAIIVLDEPANNALGVYSPYDGYGRDVPAVYVDQEVGQRLLDGVRAKSRTKVTLRVEGGVEEVKSRNLIAVIPGASDELIVLNSHTDGPNGIEDNGPNIIVAMAQYLARLPKEALPRSFMVALTSGHFSGARGIQSFIDQHMHDGLLDRMAAVLCLEHLGAEEWVSGPGGRWTPTGRPEPYMFFMPEIPALVDASEKAIRRAASAPTLIVPPTRPGGSGRTGRAHDNVWPGEGQAFWGRVKVPTANYIAGPNYLFNWGISTADKVDYQRIQRETVAFTEMVLDLSRVPMSMLRQKPLLKDESVLKKQVLLKDGFSPREGHLAMEGSK